MKDISIGNGAIGVVSTLGNLYTVGDAGFGQLGLGIDALYLEFISYPQRVNAIYFNNERVTSVYYAPVYSCFMTTGSQFFIIFVNI